MTVFADQSGHTAGTYQVFCIRIGNLIYAAPRFCTRLLRVDSTTRH